MFCVSDRDEENILPVLGLLPVWKKRNKYEPAQKAWQNSHMKACGGGGWGGGHLLVLFTSLYSDRSTKDDLPKKVTPQRTLRK